MQYARCRSFAMTSLHAQACAKKSHLTISNQLLLTTCRYHAEWSVTVDSRNADDVNGKANSFYNDDIIADSTEILPQTTMELNDGLADTQNIQLLDNANITETAFQSQSEALNAAASTDSSSRQQQQATDIKGASQHSSNSNSNNNSRHQKRRSSSFTELSTLSTRADSVLGTLPVPTFPEFVDYFGWCTWDSWSVTHTHVLP
jgi:hypothetical protein